MKKKIFKYKKGDRVPEHIMRCDNPNLVATFNVDVFVTYNRFYLNQANIPEKYTVLVRPQNPLKDDEDCVIFIKNNNGKASEGTFKCNKLLVYNPWGMRNIKGIYEVQYGLWGIE